MDKYLDTMITQYDRGGLSRRQLVAALTGIAAFAGLGTRVSAQDESKSTFQATSLNHLALSVTDIPKSREFYVKHLGLTVTRESRSNCFMNCGPHFLALFKSQQAGLNHYCYTIKNYNADQAVETLKSAGFKPRRAENRVYFNDPDGLEVQVSAANR